MKKETVIKDYFCDVCKKPMQNKNHKERFIIGGGNDTSKYLDIQYNYYSSYEVDQGDLCDSCLKKYLLKICEELHD